MPIPVKAAAARGEKKCTTLLLPLRILVPTKKNQPQQCNAQKETAAARARTHNT
jgi:hypothetical protein